MKNVIVKSDPKIPLHYHLMKVMDKTKKIEMTTKLSAYTHSEKYKGKFDLFASVKRLSNL